MQRESERKGIAVIIPAWNEEGRIGRTVHAARRVSGVDSVLVVDDGSEDNTASEARKAGADVLVLPENRGKGHALREGIRHCGAKVMLLLDADLEDSAVLAEALLAPVLSDEADMAIARFGGSGPGGFGLARRLARWGIRVLAGLSVESPLSGQRAVHSYVLDRVRLADGWGIEVALTIDAVRLGFRVLEVPVPMSHRETGRTWKGFLHRSKQFVAVARALLNRFLYRTVASS